jgi:NADH:ubiquinone oxidoreductase subunit 5 (subunit L)/multisubunit Na+/H+ antiporter MnhA subunit
MSDAGLILIAPCSLLVGAAVQMLIAKICSARVKGIVAALFCVPALIAAIATVPLVQSGGAVDWNAGAWDGPLALVLHVDALSALFALMGAGIGGFVLLYSIGYMAHDKAATRFYATMLIFIAGFIGLVFSANLFIFYACWEVVGLCSFSLVGFWYTNPEAVRGARKVLMMTHLAGYGLLAAILVLYFRAGTAVWTDPAVGHAFTGGVFFLMLASLIAKSVQVPLHTWIPEAMAAPTPVSALLHAACYVKAGVYLAARMHSFGAWPYAWGQSLMWVGTITMAVGVMYAMVQTDLKRMLAYSTVSQIGYMMMGLGIGTPLAITAGLLHCLNHGFFKGGLFLTAGSVQHAAGTRDMNQLGGLAPKMPHTTLSWLIGVGSMMGFPLMSGFASKWMLYAAALQSGNYVPAVVAWAASLGTVFMGVKATSAVFLGSTTEATRDAHESPPSMLWGMGLLAAGSIVLGVAPQLAVNTLLNPVLRVFSAGAAVNVTWLGLSTDAGTFSSVGGLVLAIVSLAAGGLIYAVAYLARPSAVTITSGGAAAFSGGGIFTGGEPLSSDGRLTASDFSRIFEQNWETFFRWTNVDRAYLGVWSGLQAASRAVASLASWMERNSAPLIVLLSAAGLAGARWLLTGVDIKVAAESSQVPLLLVGACAIGAAVLVIAAAASQSARRHAPVMLLVGAVTIAGLVVAGPWLRLGLLEAGALLTVLLVFQTAHGSAVRFSYLAVVLISAGCSVSGELLGGTQAQAWKGALLLTGICVKLAAIPFFFWLLRLADEIPAVVLGAIIAVVDMAAFGEFLMGAQANPGMFGTSPILLYAAAVTSFIAALLMLTQRSLKRLLVLSTIEDIGFLLLGVAAASQMGVEGALAGAATHAVAKALLFACLSAPEAAGDLQVETRGLAARYPVSAFGFLFGLLAMLGVPPTLGFIGRWRLYESALRIHPALAAVFIASSALALIAYVLALTRNWWGPPASGGSTAREPRTLQSAVVVLVVILLAAGMWPQLMQMLLGGRL